MARVGLLTELGVSASASRARVGNHYGKLGSRVLTDTELVVG